MPLVIARIPVWDEILKFLGWCLNGLYSWTGNYGVAIILLTIAVRIITLPLTIKQTSSMIGLQKLQPQMKELQKKYKGDREILGQEMMKLYKEHKVNPLGGCLPMLIQLPVIFALFEVLRRTGDYLKITATTQLGFLGISDLRATGSVLWSGGKIEVASKQFVNIKGGEYAAVIILILLTVVTGYFSAKQMMVTDSKQGKWTALLPVVMGVFAWILPAGVTLYIIVTNIFTVGQQFIQLRLISREEEDEETKGKQEAMKGTSGAKKGKGKVGGRAGQGKSMKKPPEKTVSKKGKGKPSGAKRKAGSDVDKGRGKGGKGGRKAR